ncbi:MAG: hypothetical protein U1F36_14230 [Planctomycetota bacterium]
MIAETPLSTGGWAFLLISTIAVTALTLWCYVRVLAHEDKRTG